MSWFSDLEGDNFLAVLDVMIDIKNELDILADDMQIPIMQTKLRFPQLFPIDSPDMRDKYCKLRWKATVFLMKKGIINSYENLQNGHRWEAFIKIELDKEKFVPEFEKIREEYQKKVESQMNIEQLKEKRLLFLHCAYNLSNANEDIDIESYKLGKDLGFSDEFTSQVIRYLDKEGLIRFKEESGSVIGISHNGIVEVEKALSKPDEPTEYFPPAKNVIIIHEMKGSQIQIDSPNATQIQTSDKELFDAFKDLLGFINSNYSQLKLPEEKEQEFQADIKTIEAQVSSPKPKRSILKESLASMRVVLEGVMVQVIAQQILDKLPVIEQMLQSI